MSQILPLRGYQRAALDAVWAAVTEVSRPAVVLPTGGGKTVCFAHLLREFKEREPDRRGLVLVHTDELVTQAYAKIKAVAPHLEVGIVKAKRNDVRSDVIVASVQSLRAAGRRAQIQRVGLIIVDECHHATAPTYRTILEHFGCFADSKPTAYRAMAVGFTATLARGDGGPLGKVWERVAFSRDIAWMIRKKYLINVHGKRVQVPELDLSKVRRSGGDFREGDLGEALVDSLAPEAVAKAYAEHAHDRKGLLFAPTVASAEAFAEAFLAQGITCEVVSGAMPLEERRAVLARQKCGQTQVVANCAVLTEGYDDPEVSCVVVARPTRSKPLYIQMVGRGLRVDPARPYEDQDCLILDVVGASAKHDLRSLADLSEKEVKEPRDGQTLLDLEDELDAGEEELEPDPEHLYEGPVEVVTFDPLAARSARVWLRTDGGAYFAPAGKDHYVFLVPATGPEGEPGRYTVAWATRSPKVRRWTCGDPDGLPRQDRCSCGLQCSGRPGGLTEHAGLDLELAMTWAEDLAIDLGANSATLYDRKAPWRRKAPTVPTLRMAEALGIRVRPGMKAGEVSDRIDTVNATARIDPIVRVLTRS